MNRVIDFVWRMCEGSASGSVPKVSCSVVILHSKLGSELIFENFSKKLEIPHYVE